MSVKYLCRFCLLLSLFLSVHIASYAQLSLTLTGSWSYTVPATDITEAGNDFTGTYASSASQVQIGVDNGGGFLQELFGYNWRVSVRKTDANWDNTASIFVRRTNNGSPIFSWLTLTLTGGQAYQQITGTDQIFFSGNRGARGINIQYELRGVSVVMAAQSYSTTIVYTVTAQ